MKAFGEGADLTVKHLDDIRESTVLFHLTKHLIYHQYRDPGEEPKLHLLGQLKRITRQWMKGYLKLTGNTRTAQLMYQDIANKVCELIKRAIKMGICGVYRSF
ncbi:hypothetical protein U2F10_11000 [Leptothoe sp. EHU-05/26/07-4]